MPDIFDGSIGYDLSGFPYDGSASVPQPPARPFGILQVLLYDEYFNLKRELNNFTNLYWEYNRIGGCGQCTFSVIQSADQHEKDFAPRTSVKIVIDGEVRYQGQIAKYVRSVQTGSEAIMPVFFGYLLNLDNVVVRRSYVNTEVSEIIKDIMDQDVIPNVDVDYSDVDIDETDYVVQSITFNHTVKDAFAILGQLAGNYEWGVDRDRLLYFKRPDRIVRHVAVLGREIQSFQQEKSYEAIQNIVNVFGSGGFLGRVSSSLSQRLFGYKETNVFESAVSEASDGNRIAAISVKFLGASQRRTNFSYMKDDEFLERSLPIGAMAITTSSLRRLKKYGASAPGRRNTYGRNTSVYPNKYGNLANDQIGTIRYSLAGKGLNVGISLTENIPTLGDQLKRVEYEIRDLQRR